MQTVKVGLGERSYDIRIAEDIIDKVGEYLPAVTGAGRFVVVADDRVAGLYGERLLASLKKAGLKVDLVTFAHGEEHKNLNTIAGLASDLARLGADRRSCLVAIGGGVTGDITGFLAASYMRGIDFVQVPTTLLAQVDSSVGGKTGVDIPEGKNLVGAFYQPRAVFIDPLVLKTLPADEFLNGVAEVIKYGVIWDADFFADLERRRPEILAMNPDVLAPMIRRCCEIKAEVVAADEREGDLRRVLNFGHTIGHAAEAASGFAISHGRAVAMGMVAAAELAVAGGHFAAEGVARIRSLIADFGLPVAIPDEPDRREIKKYLLTDEKTVGGKVFFVLPQAIGRVVITSEVAPEAIDRVIAPVGR